MVELVKLSLSGGNKMVGVVLFFFVFSFGCCQAQNPTPPDPFTCPEDFGYFPHPTDCSQYYVCVFGGALLESCTGGLMYSNDLQTCDWPRNVQNSPCHGNNTTVSNNNLHDNRIAQQPSNTRSRTRGVATTTTTVAPIRDYAYRPIKIESYGDLSSVIATREVGSNQGDVEGGRSGRSYVQSGPGDKGYYVGDKGGSGGGSVGSDETNKSPKKRRRRRRRKKRQIVLKLLDNLKFWGSGSRGRGLIPMETNARNFHNHHQQQQQKKPNSNTMYPGSYYNSPTSRYVAMATTPYHMATHNSKSPVSIKFKSQQENHHMTLQWGRQPAQKFQQFKPFPKVTPSQSSNKLVSNINRWQQQHKQSVFKKAPLTTTTRTTTTTKPVKNNNYYDDEDDYYYDYDVATTKTTTTRRPYWTTNRSVSGTSKYANEQYPNNEYIYSNQRYAANVSYGNVPQQPQQQPQQQQETEDDDEESYYVYEDDVNGSGNQSPDVVDVIDYKYPPQQPQQPQQPQYIRPTTRQPLTTTTTTTTTPRPRSRTRPQSPQSPRTNSNRPTLKPKSSIVPKQSQSTTPVRDVYLDAPSRPLPVYATPTPNSPASKCKRDTCLIPDCNCGGRDIPGGLHPQDTPQIVLLTFDDSVNDLNKMLYRDLFEKGRKNPNGCPISATFYVSHEWTDYSQVQNLAADGHEIASHSVSHSFGESFSQKKWEKEINGQREILSAYGGVKLSEIRGMRAPFLAIGGNNMFKMLHDLNFTYDSSMPVYENRPPSWPYTLDYKIHHDCMIPPCPTKSYPGVWEVPMVMWQDLKGGRCSMGDACSNPPTAEGVYQMLAKNFERHYTTNRAPFGLYYHAAWFTTPHHKEGFEAFLDTLVSMDDVWLVTNWQALQWIRNPTENKRIDGFAPWAECRTQEHRPPRCNHSRVCNLWHKSGVRYMKTCQSCPEKYPWTGATGVPFTL